MTEKWYDGWWTIPLILILLFAAWKAYPIIKSAEFLKKMGK